MCGCNQSSGSVSYRITNNNTPVESKYNINQLQIWLNQLNSIKLQNTYEQYNITTVTLNSYLGVVKSAIRNPDNIGYFENTLDLINNFINYTFIK